MQTSEHLFTRVMQSQALTREYQRIHTWREFIARNRVTNGTRLTMTYTRGVDAHGRAQLVTVTGPCKLVSANGSAINAIHIQGWVVHHALLSQIVSLSLA